MNTGPLDEPVNKRNRSRPALAIALIMFTRNRLPVRVITGLWPTGAHDRPAAASERTSSSSSHNTTPPPPAWPGHGWRGTPQPASSAPRVLLQGAPLGLLRAD